MIPLLSVIGSLANTWLTGKADQAKAKQDVKLKVLQSEENWEKIMAEGSKDSWKDEWFTVLLSIPMILCFIPAFAPTITEGFAVLTTMPEYYKGFLGAAIAASFGIKGLTKWKK